MERRFLPLWVLVAPRNPNPQASLRISLLDEERLLQLSQPGVSHLAQPGASFLAFALFMGISMSITAFPVLVRILQDRGNRSCGAPPAHYPSDFDSVFCEIARRVAIPAGGNGYGMSEFEKGLRHRLGSGSRSSARVTSRMPIR